MIPSSPVNCNIRQSSQHYISSIDTTPSSQLTKMIQPLESWTIKTLINFKQRFQFSIIPYLSFLVLFVMLQRILFSTSDPFLKIIDVMRVMKKHQLIFSRLFRLKHLKMLVEIVALNEGMSHFYSFCFHGMLFAEVIVCYCIVVEIAYLTHMMYIKIF